MAAHFLIRKKLFNSKCTQLHVTKDFAVAEKKLHLTISGRKYDPGKKASKRKHTSDVKTADPKPSTSQDKSVSEQQPQDESISEQQPQDESVSEQQPQDKSIPEQQQDVPTTKQQDKASDTLTSQSSDDSMPDYGPALKIFYNQRSQFCTKETKIQFTSENQIYLINFVLFLFTDQKETQATF